MISAQQAISRLKLNEKNFRAGYYVQKFFPPAGGALTPFQPRPFPSGAVILGITASSFVPNAAPSAQSARNRQLFEIDFAYVGGEGLIIDGPVIADALLGGGDSDIFPAKELVIAATQAIQCRTGNLTSGLLTVHVVYHCLVNRFAA